MGIATLDFEQLDGHDQRLLEMMTTKTKIISGIDINTIVSFHSSLLLQSRIHFSKILN